MAAAHLSIDPVEEALRAAGLPAAMTGVAAYEAVRAGVETCLAAGRHVVVDAVNDSEPARSTWRRAAGLAGAELRFVLLTLADRDLHRARLEGRIRPFVHVAEPPWTEVGTRPMAPWTDDVLRVDAAAPVPRLVDAVLQAVLPA